MRQKQSAMITNKQSPPINFKRTSRVHQVNKMSTILKYVNNKLSRTKISKNLSECLSKEVSYKSLASKSTCALSNQGSSKSSGLISKCISTNKEQHNTNEDMDSSNNSLISFKAEDDRDMKTLKEENACLREELKFHQAKLFALENTAKTYLEEDLPIDNCYCPKPMKKTQRSSNNSNYKDKQFNYIDCLYLNSINELTLNDDI